MATLTLLCAFLPGPLVFLSVEIAHDATVTALQKAIVSKLSAEGLDGFIPVTFELYIAKDNGAWIEINDAEAQLRRASDDSSHLEKLHGPRSLNHETCFGRAPALGDDNNIHVLVLRREVEYYQPQPKRLKREQDATELSLQDLWQVSALKRLTMPAMDELKSLLLRPLPFRMTNCLDDREIHDACDPNGPLYSCVELESLINAFVLTVKPAKHARPTSVRAWQTLYDALLQIPITLCAGGRYYLKGGRNAAAPDERSNNGRRKRPDVVLQHGGLVYLRGEERVSGLEECEIAQHDLKSKMRGWSKIFYGDLPYIPGYATAGDEIQIVTIESDEDFDGRCRMNDLVSFGILDVTTALKVFYNLAFVLALMIDKSERLYPYGMIPFDSNVNATRTITMLDGAVERTIDQLKAPYFHRHVEVYEALEGLNSLGSETTHLQTVEFMAVLPKTERYGQLVVELAPIGVLALLSFDSVRVWLTDILTALQYLHGCGYCHGDVTWRNVVYVPSSTGSGYWVLIDMDKCRPPHEYPIVWPHPFVGETLRFEHALYQVGKMLSELQFEVASDITAVKKRLLGAVKEEKVDINELLVKLGQ